MNTTIPAHKRELFGHPIGLYILFFTEMWERFSYYGMRAILVLFLVAETTGDNPGFGWLDADALSLYGWYTMFVYVASIPGGIIADRLIGQKKAVMIGGLLLCLGHGTLALQAEWAFFTGLVLIVLGVGMLKPNISTMVGGLYPKNEQNKRDLGFYIFYMGINLGAFLSALIVGYVGEKWGWHYGFGLAGIGMLLGQMTFVWGQKFLSHVGDLVEAPEDEKDLNLFTDIFKHKNSLFSTLAVSAIGLFVYFNYSWSYGLLVIGLSFAVGIAIVIYNLSNPIEKDRLLVVYLSFLIIIVFWGSFEQAGGLMNIYTEQKTDRMAHLWIMRLIFIIPIIFFLGKGVISTIKKQQYTKYWYMLAGLIAVIFYFINKKMFTTDPWEVPASWFQSLNALFILIFATLIGAFWVWWKNRGKESSSVFKMAVGVIIMGWGFFFMSGAVVQYETNGSSAMYWLVFAYLFHTIGELCASPVALSYITKLSPERFVAFMMGAYFAMTGLGNKVAGSLGELSTEVGEMAVFTGIAIFCTIFGILVIFIVKPLKRLMHGAENLEVDTLDEAEGFELEETV